MIDLPKSDLSRSKVQEPDQTWPEWVKIQLCWTDSAGRPMLRTETISANQFFGRGQFGAPMEGSSLIAVIENMRRAGPPKFKRRQNR